MPARPDHPQHAAARLPTSLGLLVLLLSLLWSFFSQPAAGQTAASSPGSGASQTAISELPVTTLELGKPLERDMSGGMRHRYEIVLVPGQYMKVEIKPTGLQLGVILRLPGGETRQLFQSFGSEKDLVFGEVAEQPGSYVVDVYTAAKAPAGHYEIRLADLHPATDQERSLQEARKLFTESFRLHRAGRNAQALPLMQRSVEIREKELGPDDLLVAITLGVLASIYDDAGDFATAESLYLRALKIREKQQGPDSPAVAEHLVQLGSFYLDKGDYRRAEEMEQRVLSIYEKAQMLESPFAAGAFENLGDLYYETGNYQNAENYYQRSRAIWEKMLGPDHFHLAPSYTHLGRVAYDAGNYPKATAMFQKALALGEKGLSADHPNLTVYLNDLGMVYCTTGDYPKGVALYQRAISINEEKASMGRTSAQESLFGLARCLTAEGRAAEAVKPESRASELEEHYIELNLAVGSEREKLAVLANLASRLSRNISLHAEFSPDDPAARDLSVTSILERKGRLQDAMSASLAALRQRLSADDQKVLDQLGDATTRLANLVLEGPQKTAPDAYQKEIKALADERENLEAEVSRRSAGSYPGSGPITLSAIEAAIPENAALIEFAIYRPFHPQAPDNQQAYDKPHYIAYLIHHQGEVQWQELGPASVIDEAVTALRAALRDPERGNVQKLARTVDHLVMQPIRNKIGGATLLLVSPDGELNLIPFAALVDEQGKYLIERYSITYLTSGRDLLRLQVARESKSAPVVVADPNYGDPPLQTDKAVAIRNGKRDNAAQIDFSQVFFGPLPGANEEVRALRQLLPNATFLTGDQATKAAVKNLTAPSILHIATHGFFLSAPDETAPASDRVGTRGINAKARIDNPLLRSGLALAGANRRDESGILTALEASGLNLWGTRLVVLSACDTGIGQVRNGEGVYGLRRALVLAGAQSQLMSLWPISDRATRDLMIAYYKDLVSGYGRGDALRRAQLQILQNRTRRHPYYWSGFIQTGEWANLEGKR